MNDQAIEGEEKPEELILVKQLIDKGKSEQAIHLINNFEETKGHTLYEIVSCHLLKCELLYQQGFLEELVRFAEKTYKESLRLGKNLLSVDALYFRALALIWLYKIEDATEIIKHGEELLKTLTNKSTRDYMKTKARLVWIRGASNNKFFNLNGDVNIALEHFYQSLELQEEVGDNQGVALSIVSIIFNLGVIKGETDIALKYIERFLALVEKKELKNKHQIALGLSCVKQVYSIRGDLDQSIKYCEQSLAVFKELNNKLQIAILLLNLGELHRMKGENDRALEYGEQCLALFNEVEMLRYRTNGHALFIRILIDKGELEQAQQHLDEIEQINNQLKDKKVNFSYLYHKAMILKTSPRAKNRVEAEEILREIIVKENINFLDAILELCDLLLVELRMTNDLEVLEEIESFIARLLDESERMNSYAYLAETYFLKAKLALITLDVKSTRLFLSQAQQIAKKYGMNQLAIKISNEHDELLNQLSMWENLKQLNTPLADRIKLTRLGEHMENMVRKRVTKTPVLETEQPVLLTIISKKGSMIFSNPFTADMTFDVNRMVDFLSSFNKFSDQIFSESLDRVRFLDFKLILKEIDSFIICYMFKGQSYNAQQKLLHFSSALTNQGTIKKILDSSAQSGLPLSKKEITIIEELISESFLSDPNKFQVPFKAYEGDLPYLFVSYAHVDKIHVYPIIDYLNMAGIKIWYDEGIPISQNWRKVIVENIEKCKAFLVFITRQIIDSDNVRKEINFALNRKKAFFAVFLKETKLPSELEYEIGGIQYMKKYLMPESEFYDKLKKGILSLF